MGKASSRVFFFDRDDTIICALESSCDLSQMWLPPSGGGALFEEVR
jgi:hypothetical protein